MQEKKCWGDWNWELSDKVPCLNKRRSIKKSIMTAKYCWDANNRNTAVVDPDLELRGEGGGGGAVLIYLPQVAIFLLPKIRGGAGPPGPSPRSATALFSVFLVISVDVNNDRSVQISYENLIFYYLLHVHVPFIN